MDNRRECCRQPENLERFSTGRPDLTLDRCRVCGARHYEASVDPIKLSVLLKKVG